MTGTDARARRTAALAAAAKAKSQAKNDAAEKAIRTLIKRGDPITFQAVQREAGVSHAFLYTHADLRERIEHLRAKSRPTPVAVAPSADSESTIVAVLTRQLNDLRARHRSETDALRAALEQAHGENLELRRELDRRGGRDCAT